MAYKPKTDRTPEEQLAAIRANNARYARKWRAANPEKEAAIKHRYWEKKLAETKKNSTQEPTI